MQKRLNLTAISALLGSALGRGGHIWEGLNPAPGSVFDSGRECEPPAQCQERGSVRGFL